MLAAEGIGVNPLDNRGMALNPTSRTPFWLRRPVILDRIAQALVWVVISLSVVVPLGQGDVTSGVLLVTACSAIGFALGYRAPWAGLIFVAAAPSVAAVFHVDPIYAWNIAVFAVFRFALTSLPGLLVGLLTGAFCFLGYVLYDGWNLFGAEASIAAILTFAAGAAGGAIRAQSQYWRSLEARAEEALASRDGAVRRRVAEERLRIARDLHDVVGHEVAVVSMQLGVAEVNLPAEADASREAIDNARSGVQSVLTEMQAILQILRRGETEASNEVLPEIGYLGALIQSYEAIGLSVRGEIGELPAQLDPAVGAAAFRIVQEALTNAHKYGTGLADVSVLHANGELVITVSNAVDIAARQRGETSSGFGLVGMRERAASVGGSLKVQDEGETFTMEAILKTNGAI
ncbi:sensor histidine kinase [Microbacterium sp.]|uniref:sensor histidine kinase n=1 Tax=Microbacterium sp. TaxID=51671 RepID=UPI00273480DF|nr:histidine kinase [Microbacterium sp.]MDP3951678.1 histidine kinase [Microbacterium sp.]